MALVSPLNDNGREPLISSRSVELKPTATGVVCIVQRTRSLTSFEAEVNHPKKGEQRIQAWITSKGKRRKGHRFIECCCIMWAACKSRLPLPYGAYYLSITDLDTCLLLETYLSRSLLRIICIKYGSVLKRVSPINTNYIHKLMHR